MNKKTSQNNQTFTHFIRLKNHFFQNYMCNICFLETSNIRFSHNDEIVLLCQKCTIEFIRLTFYHYDKSSFCRKDSNRTDLVFIFFADYIFSKAATLEPEKKTENLKRIKFFQHPFQSYISKKSSPQEKFEFLQRICARRLR